MTVHTPWTNPRFGSPLSDVERLRDEMPGETRKRDLERAQHT